MGVVFVLVVDPATTTTTTTITITTRITFLKNQAKTTSHLCSTTGY
jgi:hypothetical protein